MNSLVSQLGSELPLILAKHDISCPAFRPTNARVGVNWPSPLFHLRGASVCGLNARGVAVLSKNFSLRLGKPAD